MSNGSNVGGFDTEELLHQQALIEARAEEVRKQLDKGVTRAEFKQLYALQSALKRAAGVLADIRASFGL